LAHPFAGPFRAGAVHNLIDQVALPFGIGNTENIASDFNQVALQFAAVPGVEHIVKLRVGKTEQLLEQVIGFANQLHVTVFDAVVDHFDVVSRTARSDPLAARHVIGHAGGNRLQNVAHDRPCLGAASGHQARPQQRALFAPGDSDADVQHAGLLDSLSTPFGVEVKRVSSIENHIARL